MQCVCWGGGALSAWLRLSLSNSNWGGRWWVSERECILLGATACFAELEMMQETLQEPPQKDDRSSPCMQASDLRPA